MIKKLPELNIDIDNAWTQEEYRQARPCIAIRKHSTMAALPHLSVFVRDERTYGRRWLVHHHLQLHACTLLILCFHPNPTPRALQCRSRTVRCSREQWTRAPSPLVPPRPGRRFFWHAPSPACPYSGRRPVGRPRRGVGWGAPLPDWLVCRVWDYCCGATVTPLTGQDWHSTTTSSLPPPAIAACVAHSARLLSSAPRFTLAMGGVAACMHARSVRVREGGAGALRSSHLTGSASGRPRPCEPCAMFADPGALPFTGSSQNSYARSAVTSCRVTLAVVVVKALHERMQRQSQRPH
jgi:hypothetical protein